MSQRGQVEHLNPEGLHSNPAFTNVVTVTGPAKTVYVGGQNAVTADGQVVGKGDLGAQAKQIFENLETALHAAGAKLEDVIKWSVFVVDGQPIQPAFEVCRQVWGAPAQPAPDQRRRSVVAGGTGLARRARGRCGDPGMTAAAGELM